MSTPSLFDRPPLSQPAQPEQTTVANQVPVHSLVPLTEEDVKRALPQNLRSAVNQSLVDMLNNISTDPLAAENIRDNFVSYSSVLKDGKFKTEDYINAVAYVSYKIMGHTNEDAYAKTFPQRYARLLANSATKKEISSYVAAYHKGKLVNLIMEQSLVPSWVLNQDLFQKALNTQAKLMLTATSELVRTQAANSILTHLKKPEPKGDFQINLNQADNSGLAEMRNMIGQLAQQQRTLIEQGSMKTIDVAGSKLIKEEAEDVG